MRKGGHRVRNWRVLRYLYQAILTAVSFRVEDLGLRRFLYQAILTAVSFASLPPLVNATCRNWTMERKGKYNEAMMT